MAGSKTLSCDDETGKEKQWLDFTPSLRRFWTDVKQSKEVEWKTFKSKAKAVEPPEDFEPQSCADGQFEKRKKLKKGKLATLNPALKNKFSIAGFKKRREENQENGTVLLPRLGSLSGSSVEGPYNSPSYAQSKGPHESVSTFSFDLDSDHIAELSRQQRISDSSSEQTQSFHTCMTEATAKTSPSEDDRQPAATVLSSVAGNESMIGSSSGKRLHVSDVGPAAGCTSHRYLKRVGARNKRWHQSASHGRDRDLSFEATVEPFVHAFENSTDRSLYHAASSRTTERSYIGKGKAPRLRNSLELYRAGSRSGMVRHTEAQVRSDSELLQSNSKGTHSELNPRAALHQGEIPWLWGSGQAADVYETNCELAGRLPEDIARQQDDMDLAWAFERAEHMRAESSGEPMFKMPSSCPSDSLLKNNTDATVNHWKRLGLAYQYGIFTDLHVRMPAHFEPGVQQISGSSKIGLEESDTLVPKQLDIRHKQMMYSSDIVEHLLQLADAVYRFQCRLLHMLQGMLTKLALEEGFEDDTHSLLLESDEFLAENKRIAEQASDMLQLALIRVEEGDVGRKTLDSVREQVREMQNEQETTEERVKQLMREAGQLYEKGELGAPELLEFQRQARVLEYEKTLKHLNRRFRISPSHGHSETQDVYRSAVVSLDGISLHQIDLEKLCGLRRTNVEPSEERQEEDDRVTAVKLHEQLSRRESQSAPEDSVWLEIQEQQRSLIERVDELEGQALQLLSEQTDDLFELNGVISEQPWQPLMQEAHELRQLAKRYQRFANLQEPLGLEKRESGAQKQEISDQLQALKREDEQIVEQGPRTKECMACTDSKDRMDFPAKAPTASCEHPVNTCSECLRTWLASEVESKGCEGLKCPECCQTLQYGDVQLAASAETFVKYDRLAMHNLLSSEEEFAWCLRPNCGSGQLNVENSDFMICASCDYRQCLKHKVEWHKGETCEQYEYRTSGQQQREEEAKTNAMIDSVSKTCPGEGCGWRIQKTDGCDHMTCKKCRHQFCWECLAAQAEIKRIGNTAHETRCKYHSTNLHVAFPFNAH